MTRLPAYPFEPDRFIGTISEVGADTVRVNLPGAASPSPRWQHGHRIGDGEVGELVFLECETRAIFGRLTHVRLPERERLEVQPAAGGSGETNPLGSVRMLATLDLATGEVQGGLLDHPRLGGRVFSAHPLLVKWMAESAQRSNGDGQVFLRLASLYPSEETAVTLTPESLFGRHCAVLGATGGGKSWTLARLIEEAARHRSKILLLDATGEFHTLSGLGERARHVFLGGPSAPAAAEEEVVFPYRELTENDLFALFKPSAPTQAPKLRHAISSLRLAHLVPGHEIVQGGVIHKAAQPKAPYESLLREHAAEVENPRADFDIGKLAEQIDAECVYPYAGNARHPDYTRWGAINLQEAGYCIPLLNRIDDMLQAEELSCIFRPGTKLALPEVLEQFAHDPRQRLLRVSLRYLPFDHNAREIVTNAIGRHLLALARRGSFRSRPLVVFLDEAHQFLDKTLGDESSRYPLDAFDLLGKEGRKFGLNLCLATQRPRDIPEGVLSQMGTFIVHRLTNDRDREIIERASGNIDRAAAELLPTLVPGEAILVGADFPIPLTIRIARPDCEPESRGPDFQAFWRAPRS